MLVSIIIIKLIINLIL